MNKNDFSVDVQATILDSLADAQENYENAADVVKGASEEAFGYFIERADAVSLTIAAFHLGEPLNVYQQTAIVDALDLSIANTLELELDEAHQDYTWAKQYVLNLSI